MELQTFNRTAERLLAMPKPAPVRTYDRPGRRPGVGVRQAAIRWSRRKWRNDVATVMVHELIEESGVTIVRTMGTGRR